MRLLVANGAVVLPDGLQDVDILCEDGQIARVLERGAGASADEVVDAAGKLVFPGFVDPHVHSRDPGLTEKEDFAHSTLGALLGGTTTIIEMPNAVPPVDSLDVLQRRKAQHEQVSWVDFGLWGMSLGESNLDQLEQMVRGGAAAIKLFWGYALDRRTRQLVYNLDDVPPDSLLLPPDNGTVLRVFRAIAGAGGILAAHCEDRDINMMSERSMGHPIESYRDFLSARPSVAEAASIAVAAELARDSNCRFHVVHVASAAALEVIRAAKHRGISMTAETCPQYLTLTDEDYARVGPVMKVYPPVRTKTDQDALWSGVNEGGIDCVGSDHAPHTVAEKSRPLRDQPAGAVGCETFGPVMLDALLSGKIDIRRFTEVMATSSARLFGIYPRKGAIQTGSDADLTVVDPVATRVIRNDELVAKQPISPWHGVKLRGRPVTVVLRGEVAMREGRPMGEHRGRYVPSSPSGRC